MKGRRADLAARQGRSAARGGAAAAAEEKRIAESKNWPYGDRVADKNWKIRKAAFDHAKVKCEKAKNAQDPILAEFGTFPDPPS